MYVLYSMYRITVHHYAAYSPPAQLTMGFITDIGHVQYVHCTVCIALQPYAAYV